ncbi:unnamed protein product [Brachionus calyciflorus]|uniref:Sm domain-containing protein n=1 Tax=Brachionus calyciflorus TaxID=104777 RepID=A0A813SD27_9BILA|nr:unnamed protein product [Brachionus calyciflorus]
MELEKQQLIRFELREKFLRMFKNLENKPIELATFQGANVTGNFRSIDYDISNMHLNNLQTPIGVVPEALVRTSDIVYYTFSLN